MLIRLCQGETYVKLIFQGISLTGPVPSDLP